VTVGVQEAEAAQAAGTVLDVLLDRPGRGADPLPPGVEVVDLQRQFDTGGRSAGADIDRRPERGPIRTASRTRAT
jgi:hypothetical protein